VRDRRFNSNAEIAAVPKRSIAPLTEGRVRLRLLEARDLPLTLAWRNQDHIRRWFFSTDVIAPEQHRGWFARYQERDDDFVFVIEETQTLQRPVGQTALYHVDWSAGRAEFGRLMIGDPAASGIGLARLATSRLLAEAHGPLNLREVYLECRTDNARAIAVYTACGFHEDSRGNGVVRMISRHEPGGARE
jgi:diamine N-acetyltransferase